MISAEEARAKGRILIDEILDFINDIVLYAINHDREYCIITLKELEGMGANSDTILKKVYSELCSLGYVVTKEMDADKGFYLMLDWSDPNRYIERQPVWVERTRFNGEKFYECSGCGSIAAAKKSKMCPHCGSRMENGEGE